MARLNHLTLFVRDHIAARDWYVTNLGLDVEFEIPEARTTAVRDRGDFAIFLAERSDLGGSPRCILYFQVDDVDRAFERMRAGDVAFDHEPRQTEWGYGPETTDPDGHTIRLWDYRSEVPREA